MITNRGGFPAILPRLARAKQCPDHLRQGCKNAAVHHPQGIFAELGGIATEGLRLLGLAMPSHLPDLRLDLAAELVDDGQQHLLGQARLGLRHARQIHSEATIALLELLQLGGLAQAPQRIAGGDVKPQQHEAEIIMNRERAVAMTPCGREIRRRKSGLEQCPGPVDEIEIHITRFPTVRWCRVPAW